MYRGGRGRGECSEEFQMQKVDCPTSYRRQMVPIYQVQHAGTASSTPCSC
jgi:hypothetical protein